MTERSDRTNGLLAVGAMVALMWLLEVIDVIAGNRLDAYGIEPRSTEGLAEVASAPFLHFGFDHLISNTVPFAIMGAVIALSGAVRVLLVTAIVALVSGLGVWLVAPAGSITLGASGLVFGYVLYLVSRGLFARKATYLLGGILVLSVYGGVLWGLLPSPGISWQGHLFGAVGGVAAASLLHGEDGRARSRTAP